MTKKQIQEAVNLEIRKFVHTGGLALHSVLGFLWAMDGKWTSFGWNLPWVAFNAFMLWALFRPSR